MMIFSRTTISLLCMLLMFSVFIANLLNIIATDPENNKYSKESENYTKFLVDKYGKITDTSENIIWFLQISDIHISIFRDPGRISQFQQFCDSTIRKINPTVVLASGDLTDAKAKDNLGSSQVKKEWIYYYNIIKESGITKDTDWLDIRGNHDNFNIETINAEHNYFRNYSVQGSLNPKSYIHIENKNGISAAFIGIDACPEPGVRRPFNFIGLLDVAEQNRILKLQSVAEVSADHIIWFGHYPTSCILSIGSRNEKKNLLDIIETSPGSNAYLCGHLHSMGGLVTKMYTKQKQGFLELELADWKDNRMFRLAAIDHGIFSFVDQRHNSWPFLLVTNPKHAKFRMPTREPLDLIAESTHVRLLAFSDVTIEEVTISFDLKMWQICNNKQGPLYVCDWDPKPFAVGLHTLHVVVKDIVGRYIQIEHPFCLDGTSIPFGVLPRLFLMLDAGLMFQIIFAVLIFLNLVPLTILKFQKQPPQCRRSYFGRLLRRLWLLSKIDRVYYPIALYAIYLPIGPWAVGELLDGYIGVVFAWGILIKNSYLPEPFTYMYGGVQLIFVQIPLIFVLASSLQRRLFGSNTRGVKRIMHNFPFVLLLAIQMLLAYFFWLEYGMLAVLCGPLRMWNILLSLFLWYNVINLPNEYCKKLTNLHEQTCL